MTDLLWMTPTAEAPEGENPNYLRAFDATVQKARRDWVLLDRTAFYAEGGGQPADTGTLAWDAGEARVRDVSKRGVVKHVVEGELPETGASVRGEVDWDRRYRHMRMHTAQHVLSAEAHRLLDVPTEGASLGGDASEVMLGARVAPSEVDELLDAVARVVARDLPVRTRTLPRPRVEARLQPVGRVDLARLPASVRQLRVVEVGDVSPGWYDEDAAPRFGEELVDVCPCAGTHVARTGEVGPLRDAEVEEAGGSRWRLSFRLGDAPGRGPGERKP